MNKKQILEKIKKCLALSKSANEHESAAALAKAHKLMERYSITDTDVFSAEVNERRSKTKPGVNPPSYESDLAVTIAHAFNCSVLFSTEMNWKTYGTQRFCRFIGMNIQSELAQFAYDVLSRQLSKERVAYIKTRLKRCKLANKTLRADAFCEGWVNSVVDAVNKFAKYDPASTTRKKIETYIDKNFPARTVLKDNSRTGGQYNERSLTDYFNGAEAGKDAKLNHGVGGDKLQELS